MLPKGIEEVAVLLRSLVKVWVASEREKVVKHEGGGVVGVDIRKTFIPVDFIIVK